MQYRFDALRVAPASYIARQTGGMNDICGPAGWPLRLGQTSARQPRSPSATGRADTVCPRGNPPRGDGVTAVRHNRGSHLMMRRLIVVTAFAAGISIAAAITLATPALAKGPSQARITGPGLVHAIVVSGEGEPGQQGRLATLAGLTGLFTVLFGPGAGVPAQTPTRLPPPPKASLGPPYTVIYTVPGVTPQPGEQFGQVRQE